MKQTWQSGGERSGSVLAATASACGLHALGQDIGRRNAARGIQGRSVRGAGVAVGLERVRRKCEGAARSPGFTLIELLVVVAIVSVLASMLLPAIGKGKRLAQRATCLSNLHQIGLGTAIYTSDHLERMPDVADEALQLTPPVDAAGKRYNAMGSFMPLLFPYAPDARIWLSPPVPLIHSNSWRRHFLGSWREHGTNAPERGWANYISDKLAERDPGASRYLRGRTVESLVAARNSSPSTEEWLMSPFFEKHWWPGYHDQWRILDDEPPPGGWSAHNGGRNQLYLDMAAGWVRKNIER